MKLLALIFVFTPYFALADGVQICVDSNGAAYTASITEHAGAPGFHGFLEGRGTVAAGTDLAQITLRGNLADVVSPAIEDLSYQLKHLVTPSLESLQEGAEFSYHDDPRVYRVSGVDLICSSTMTRDEYASLAK